MITIELPEDIIEEVVKSDLLEQLTIGGLDKQTKEALHRVIAYYSVPGTYLDGKYDGTDS